MGSHFPAPEPAYAPPRRAGRNPVAYGLGLGALVFVLTLVGRFAPAPVARPVADVVGLLTATAWVWAVFAGWLGRGASTAPRAAFMGGLGLLSAALVQSIADTVVALSREASLAVLQQQGSAFVTTGVAGPLLLGTLAGVLGWLTTRRDRYGAAAGIVLGLGLSGAIAAAGQDAFRGQPGLKTAVAVGAMLVGLGMVVWFGYRAIRDADSGASASDGAPETPLRRYATPGVPTEQPTQPLAPTGSTPWRPASAPDEAPTVGLHTDEAPTVGLHADDAPTQEIPAYGWSPTGPTSQRTPTDPDDLPTRANPSGGWRRG